jgi:hypothetical protein
MMKALILLLLVATTVHGEIYRWTDGRGTVHYTNSEYEIPDKYRKRSAVLNLGLPVPANAAAPATAAGGVPQPEVKVPPETSPPAAVVPVPRSRRRASRSEE